MLKNLKFAHKVALMPGLAALGFLVVLAVSATVGTGNSRLLESIEKGSVPAVDASRELEEILARIQRGLQDAVAASDKGMLSETDTLRDNFFDTLRRLENNQSLRSTEVAGLRDDFASYYLLARDNSARLIGGAASQSLVESLEKMRDQYNRIHRSLETLTRRSRTDMEQAFAKARDNQRSSLTAIVVITVFSILLLATLSFFVIRSLTAPLNGAGRGRPSAVARRHVGPGGRLPLRRRGRRAR